MIRKAISHKVFVFLQSLSILPIKSSKRNNSVPLYAKNNIMMKRFILQYSIILALLTWGTMTAFAQKGSGLNLAEIDKQVIPEDSAVRKGVLENGLTYYVCRNNKPEKQAFFYLLVKAGSVVEQDNERGIAHFVEHMQFNGTKHFPGSVIGFFRRNGLQFGHDTNAFTGFTTVRYQLNAIPVDNTQLMDSCLLLLRDWAGDAIIDAKDVESEHNVVVEEWRTKNTISFAQQLLNDLLGNSIYAKRIPIGDMDIVKNCSQKLVRNFYDRWYQPQNQAVVMVGDFDPDQMVEKVKKMFGDRKRGKTISPTPPTIPDNETPKILMYADKQQPYGSIALMMRQTEDLTTPKNTVGSMKTAFLRDEIRKAVDKKLKNLKTKYPDILDGNVSNTDIADLNDKLWVFDLDAKQDQWQRALELLAKQVELIRRKGFGENYWKQVYIHGSLSPEYNADSTAIILEDTSFVKTDRNIQSKEYVDRCFDNFFKGESILSDMARQLAERHIKNNVTSEELHQEFCRMTSGRNMLICVMMTDSTALPKKEEVEATWQRIKQMTDEELAEVEVVEAKKLERINVDSLDIPTVPGTIVSQKVLNDSISEVYLSNGVKVVFLKQKTDADMINFMIQRPQGYSVLNDDDIHYHDMLGSCVRKYKCWNGHSNVQVEAFDDRFDHGARWIQGDSLNAFRVECTLKMFYKSLTSTEVDSVEFAEQKQKLLASSMTISSPVAQSALKLGLMTAAETKRLTPPSAEVVASYNIDHLRELVKDYYSNYNGSVMVVQGEVDADSIMPYILKYVGALPSKPEPVKRMTWPADHYKTVNTTLVEKFESPAPISQTMMFYTWEKGFEYTQQSHAHNEVLKSVLGDLLLQTLRVQHNDVYSLNVLMEDALLPVPHMRITITFACNPTQRERISKDVEQLVKQMAEGNLITQDLIDNYLKTREKKSVSYKGNEYTRRRDYLTQELNGIVVKEGDMTYVRQVTPASLRAHVKQLLKQGNLHVGYLTT